jgi:hypothetical protein
MDDFDYPEPCDIPKCWRVRASTGGQWLSTLPDGSRKATTDFPKSTVFESRSAAQDAWEELVAQPDTQAKNPAWMRSPPQLFDCPRESQAPDSATFYMAMSQGRFVSAVPVSMGSGVDYVLNPILSQAAVFSSQESAFGALRKAMPAKDKNPTGSVLPLRATFGAPMPAPDAAHDPMAVAMASASARSSIAHAVPLNNAPPASRKNRAL